MTVFIISLVITKYGILGFVLSKNVKNKFSREKIESLFIFVVLVGIFILNKNREISIVNNNILMNMICAIIDIILYYVVIIVVGEKLGQEKTKNQVQIEDLTREVPFLMSLISTGILSPVFEEVIFRFYIQDMVLGNTIIGILISSFLFAIMHMVSGFSFSGLITYMGASILVGALYMLSGGILFSAIMHMIVNSIAVVVMYFGDKLKKTYKDDI